jgi:acetyl esterase/lipase
MGRISTDQIRIREKPFDPRFSVSSGFAKRHATDYAGRFSHLSPILRGLPMRGKHLFLVGLFLLACGAAARAGENYTRTRDVIYGRKYGLSLTMDVFTPKKDANGAAVLIMVSGGWRSDPQRINAGYANAFLKRGYTVFAVVHGSQPRFTVPEAVEDVTRAVRFIRSKAKDFKIDPDRIGVTGGSAGGHLSLMLGNAGDDGNPNATDPVERVSSRVQAVACFYPPTDFLNFGKQGVVMTRRTAGDPYKAAIDFNAFDSKTHLFERITDEAKERALLKQISPVTFVSAKSAPALIIHGDADPLVPLQQSELMLAKYKAAVVPAKLIVKPGAAHGWPGLEKDLVAFADWFDTYLAKRAPAAGQRQAPRPRLAIAGDRSRR